MAHIKPWVRNDLGRDVDDDDILIVNTLKFADPEWVENRRRHIGSNVELLVGYFALGNPHQIDYAYRRCLDPILAKVAEFLARKRRRRPPYTYYVIASPAGIAR